MGCLQPGQNILVSSREAGSGEALDLYGRAISVLADGLRRRRGKAVQEADPDLRQFLHNSRSQRAALLNRLG